MESNWLAVVMARLKAARTCLLDAPAVLTSARMTRPSPPTLWRCSNVLRKLPVCLPLIDPIHRLRNVVVPAAHELDPACPAGPKFTLLNSIPRSRPGSRRPTLALVHL